MPKMPMLYPQPVWLRFDDLQTEGIVKSRAALKSLIDGGHFPPGRKFGPNTRVWSREEIDEWTATRPIDRKPAPIVKMRRGRPRKEQPAMADG